MLVIDPDKTPTPQLHQYLVGSVAPRPIAFVSTLDAEGRPNLAPYSFFNVFSSNPPIAVFSSNRRVSDNTTKDTLHNARATGEVVINVVSHAIVRQAALCSVDYPPEVSEFEKAGLTPLPSDLVKPFRVQESPVQMECRVEQIIPLGEEGGAGNLIVCRILRIHLDPRVLDEQGNIDPHKMDLMGRMGRAFYVRASGAAVHKIFQPVDRLGIGFDQLPEALRHSPVLTGNELARLAALTEPPSDASIRKALELPEVQQCLQGQNPSEALQRLVQQWLETGDSEADVQRAAAVAWLSARPPKGDAAQD